MSKTILDDVRDRLVLAALDHVPFDGWSMAALRRGAEDVGLDYDAPERLFPGGVTDAVDHFVGLADRLMVEDMERADVESMPMQERLEAGIRLRLQRWASHREAVRRALSVYALPQNAGRAARATWRTVDLIWKAAGDRSTDFNWYTKRASLGAVYTATLLYWLDDPSEDSEETWDFLHRRASNVVDAIKFRRTLQERLGRIADPFGLLSGTPRRGPRRMPRGF